MVGWSKVRERLEGKTANRSRRRHRSDSGVGDSGSDGGHGDSGQMVDLETRGSDRGLGDLGQMVDLDTRGSDGGLGDSRSDGGLGDLGQMVDLETRGSDGGLGDSGVRWWAWRLGGQMVGLETGVRWWTWRRRLGGAGCGPAGGRAERSGPRWLPPPMPAASAPSSCPSCESRESDIISMRQIEGGAHIEGAAAMLRYDFKLAVVGP